MRRLGDTLERAVFDDSHAGPEAWHDLTQVLYPYSGIWYDHILPRRDDYDMTRLAAKHAPWVRFASDHYSAFVRLFQAYRKFGDIIYWSEEAARNNRSSDVLLGAHDALSGFWEHFGSTVDNLGRCFDDIPGANIGTNGIDLIRSKSDALADAYDRRTQMIHHSIVPVGLDDGMLIFNERHFDEVKTDWSTIHIKHELVESAHFVRWKQVIVDLAAAWNRLRSAVKQADLTPPSIPAALTNPKLEIPSQRESGSGSGSVKHFDAAGTTQGGTQTPYWERLTIMFSSGSGTPR